MRSIVIAGAAVNSRHDGGEDRGAGRAWSVRALMVDGASGTPLSSSAVPGVGTGMMPWAHFTVPLPVGTGELVNRLDAEQVQPDRRADDVGDAVERADLVEVDAFQRHPVDRRLGDRDLAEDGRGQFALLRREFALRRESLPRPAGSGSPPGPRLRRSPSSRRTRTLHLLDFQLNRQPERIEGRGSARRGTPASISAPSTMSPLMPLKQSKCATSMRSTWTLDVGWVAVLARDKAHRGVSPWASRACGMLRPTLRLSSHEPFSPNSFISASRSVPLCPSRLASCSAAIGPCSSLFWNSRNAPSM